MWQNNKVRFNIYPKPVLYRYETPACHQLNTRSFPLRSMRITALTSPLLSRVEKAHLSFSCKPAGTLVDALVPPEGLWSRQTVSQPAAYPTIRLHADGINLRIGSWIPCSGSQSAPSMSCGPARLCHNSRSSFSVLIRLLQKFLVESSRLYALGSSECSGPGLRTVSSRETPMSSLFRVKRTNGREPPPS